MFFRIGCYLLGEGYLILMGLLALAAVLAGYFGTWDDALTVAAVLFLVDQFREDYKKRPWRYRSWFLK